jgi:catechol 2,3-dioxygenase-like lactoylglutathione lyase family enzyme
MDDIDRAKNFYTKIFGMKVADRISESGAHLARLKGGGADVALFRRPRPLQRNSPSRGWHRSPGI